MEEKTMKVIGSDGENDYQEEQFCIIQLGVRVELL